MNAGGEEVTSGCGSNSTKVYYHLDDSATPYMSEVPVPSNLITLGDFKGYRYFCRRWDAELKSDVKAELVRDQQRLERSATTGLFELFLLSPALPSSTAAGNAGTLPRMRKYGGASVAEMPLLRPLNHHLSALALSSIVASSSSELITVDCAGGQRVSMVTGTTASSGGNTLISKRAGEHLAEPYSSTSEDPSTSGIFLRSKPAMSFGNFTGRPLLDRQKWRRQRHQKPYVPSTISSASDESSYSLPRIEEVKLRLQEAPLGISVASQDSSIFIYNIQPGSAAEKSGHLEVEETRFEDLSEKQALYLLRQLNIVKKTVTMYVAKRRPLNVGGGSSSDKSDALSQFCDTIQLDIGQWVESTNQCDVEPLLPFLDVPAVAKIYKNEHIIDAPHPLVPEQIQLMAAEKETSDEEQAAYLDRRAGVGPRLVPAVQKAKQKQQNPKRADEQANNNNADVVFATTGSDGGHPSPCPAVTSAAAVAPSVPSPLHAAMEPSVILRRMAHPCSGLDIRDRKWLKIPVPMSFIGDDMLDWLMSNVQGFKDRKCAKAFASTVLLTGHIKHVLNISAFNEKCYYIFDDSFVAERLRILRRATQQQQQQQQMDAKKEHKLASSTGAAATADNGNKMQRQPESTTEITYMSSPSSPFFGAVPPTHASQSANMLVIVNNPKYAQGPAVLNQQRNCAVPLFNGNTAVPLRQMNMNTILPAWPVSPIPFARPNQTPRLPRGLPAAAEMRDCESPEATNEYASMVQGEINCGAQFDAKFDGFLVPNNRNNNTIGGVIKHSPNYVNNNNASIFDNSESRAFKLPTAQPFYAALVACHSQIFAYFKSTDMNKSRCLSYSLCVLPTLPEAICAVSRSVFGTVVTKGAKAVLHVRERSEFAQDKCSDEGGL
uniref:DEP domain-containing protein n=1 Tax=Globodera pallida TaxID=36090 RepID=A0A183BLF8_GLOPA